MLQDITRLAIKVAADRVQCIKAYALDLALLEQAEIGLGYADILGKVLGFDVPAREHDGEVDPDRHG